jgi:hypothetical protein
MPIRLGRTREETEDFIRQAFLELHDYCDKGAQLRQIGLFLRPFLGLPFILYAI